MERSYQLPFVKDYPKNRGDFWGPKHNHPRRKVHFHPAFKVQNLEDS